MIVYSASVILISYNKSIDKIETKNVDQLSISVSPTNNYTK